MTVSRPRSKSRWAAQAVTETMSRILQRVPSVPPPTRLRRTTNTGSAGSSAPLWRRTSPVARDARARWRHCCARLRSSMPPPKRAAASLPRRHARRQPTRRASASAGAKSGLHGGLPGSPWQPPRCSRPWSSLACRYTRAAFGRQNEQLAALSSSPQRHHPHKAPPASSPPADANLALNDNAPGTKLDKKSVVPAEPSEPKPAIAPPAAVPPAATGEGSPESRDGGAIGGAPGSTTGTTGGSPETEISKSVRSNPPANTTANAPAETAAPAEETAPPVAPTNNDQNGAGPATADQAAAALGALAATPAPATSPTSPSTSDTGPAAGSKDTAAAPAGVHQKQHAQKQRMRLR